ncbi:hypothetical protein P4639_14525 [Priestia megaterium]|uniref:hypothetical protein n=1 Tax=Priestia megaterium TaxID=1404 RepID=UPI002E230288|nr:hypothetical protein [Priestia megaterium]
MAKVKVEVTNAVVGGKTHGKTLMVEEEEAVKLEKNRYVKRVAAKKSEDKA